MAEAPLPPGLGRVFLPEVHDVHPGMAPLLERLLGLLPGAAAERAALLVVPDWQGRHPLDAAPDFAARLRGLPGTLVLHGYTHSLGPDFLNWLLYGHDNRSEFARLPPGEGAARLAKGMAMLERALGRRPAWFCAPRWQQDHATAAALRAIGLKGWMLTRGLALADGRLVPIPALNFDEGDRAWRNRLATGLREGTIRRLLAQGRPFRLALHPDDLGRPAVVRQIERLSGALERDGWRPMTLDEIAGAAA